MSVSFLYAIYLPIFVVLQPFPSLARKWRSWMYRLWARAVAALFGLRVSYLGPRPSGTFILVTNHSSYLDIPVLARELDVVFVAKSEVRAWPIVGILAMSVGTIFIERESRQGTRRTGTSMDAAVEEGRSVAFFPEGRSTDGRTVLPFRASLFDGAARKQIPVVAAAIRYRTASPAPPPEEIVCWGDDTSLRAHAWRVMKLPGVEAVVSFSPARIDSDRKTLAAALHGDTLERFEALKAGE